jgi:hypothetical protein
MDSIFFFVLFGELFLDGPWSRPHGGIFNRDLVFERGWPVRVQRTPGSVRGAAGNSRPYRHHSQYRQARRTTLPFPVSLA